MPVIHIRPMHATDWVAVRRIYLEGIATGNATFQTEAPEWDYFDANHLKVCRFVAEDESGVLGWATLGAISSRPVYRGVAEVSVYVAESARGRGVGRTLMAALVPASEAAGFWTLQAGILSENSASRSLHRQFGFREVGVREKMGQLAGVWRNVVLMERRSTVIA
ncbi:GNAT family N-acetyltransferase [Burkholderiaceae bacterium DAT-1]|nr:GNAT family N-acetyltransferase [Burkholderiaceae bacterium DAT-1]